MASAKMLTARIRVVSDVRAAASGVPSALSFLGKAVSHAVEGLDRLELRIHLPEFTAEPFDMAVDRSVVDIDVVLVRGIHQLVARLDEAGTLRERLEDQEFRHGQRHVLP